MMKNKEAIASLRTLCHNCKLFPKCAYEKPECFKAIEMAIKALEAQDSKNSNESSLTQKKLDTIIRTAAIDALCSECQGRRTRCKHYPCSEVKAINALPPAQPEIIRCKDCRYWKQQTNFQGIPLSFGFCESDDMWRSLYGETYEVAHIDTDDDHYCGYAERRTDEGLNQQTGGD